VSTRRVDCEDIRHELGAYVLGALEREEESRVREHLARCTTCREEHAHLAALRPLLDLAAPGADRPALEQPSPLLEDAVLAGFAAEHGDRPKRRRRFAWPPLRIAVPSAAVGAIVAVTVLAAVGALSGDDPGSSSMTVDMTGSGGSARATLSDAEAGTVIDLEAKLPPTGRKEHYEVWMTSGDYRITAGSFRVGPDGNVDVELACGGPLDAYDGIVVTKDADETVLTAAL
jgi:hypothetical protein